METSPWLSGPVRGRTRSRYNTRSGGNMGLVRIVVQEPGGTPGGVGWG